MNKLTVTVIAGLVGVAAAAIGYAIGQRKKLNDISEKLDKTIEDICERTDVTVSDAIVQTAVKKAVKDAVEPIVTKEVTAVARKEAADIRASIKQQLEDRILSGVTDEDVRRMRTNVLERASEKATKKMTEGLDYIFDDFRNSMSRIIKRYERGM